MYLPIKYPKKLSERQIFKKGEPKSKNKFFAPIIKSISPKGQQDTPINAGEAATNSKKASANSEKTHSNAKESPFPISLGAISLIAAVLFMNLRRDRQWG
jgi:hypothetical protein